MNGNTDQQAAASSAINMEEGKERATAPLVSAPVTTAVAAKKVRGGGWRRGGGWKRGVAVFDFLLRLLGIGATLVATITMGTTDQTLPFVTQLFQFQVSYTDLPAFLFFVIGMAIASGYLLLSLPFSIVGIVRPRAVGPRLLLLICDTVMVGLSSAAAASATAIVYLAHNGNSSANWIGICQQFDDFCQSISGAVIASFVATVIFMLLVVMSAMVIRKP